jgi:hypothetical protein
MGRRGRISAAGICSWVLFVMLVLLAAIPAWAANSVGVKGERTVLFSFFRNKGEDGLYLAAGSEDGLKMEGPEWQQATAEA